MRNSKLKAYYIDADGEIIRARADGKRSAMTAFHTLGYLAVWEDVKLVPAWEKDKKNPDPL